MIEDLGPYRSAFFTWLDRPSTDDDLKAALISAGAAAGPKDIAAFRKRLASQYPVPQLELVPQQAEEQPKRGTAICGHRSGVVTVEVVEICHGRSDPIDSFVEEAYWTDTETSLTDTELDELQDRLHAEGVLEEEWWDNILGKV